MAKPPQRPRKPAGARSSAPVSRQAPKKPARPGARRPKAPPKRSMDVFHLLSAVGGALAGLMLYAVATPGQLPTGSAMLEADPRADLLLVGLHGRREADGFMHVRGAIANGRDVPCRLASVTVKFFDKSGARVADTLATAEAIAPHGRGPFEAHAHAPGAVRFEASVDLAQFEVGTGARRGRP